MVDVDAQDRITRLYAVLAPAKLTAVAPGATTRSS
jgi:hypothetical protein